MIDWPFWLQALTYIGVGSLLAGFLSAFGKATDSEVAIIVLLWPVVLVMLVGCIIGHIAKAWLE